MDLNKKRIQEHVKVIPYLEKPQGKVSTSFGKYDSKIAQYPVKNQQALYIFADGFDLSPTIIPDNPNSKKGGKYATWIKGLNELQDIAENLERFKKIINKVCKVWNNKSAEYKKDIEKPQDIRGLFITMDAELRQKDIAEKETIEEEVKKQKAEEKEYKHDSEKIKQWTKDLKQQFRGFDNK